MKKKTNKHRMGYLLPEGYMGWVEADHRYRMFATEAEYLEVEHGDGETEHGDCAGSDDQES